MQPDAGWTAQEQALADKLSTAIAEQDPEIQRFRRHRHRV